MNIVHRFQLVGFRSILLLCAVLLVPLPARALREIEIGNSPVIEDPDWPAGTLDVANLPTRLGLSKVSNTFQQGFIIDGGSTNFIYRGNTAAFQEALDRFAKIRAPARKVIIREGAEDAPWLKSFSTPDANTHVDWTFLVWTPREWLGLSNVPASLLNTFHGPVPPPTLAVNVPSPGTPGIDWSQIKVPADITIEDTRATAAGYTRDDGSVFRGDVYDSLTSKPVANAQITLDSKPATTSDATGHFELKHISTGFRRIEISAQGYVARVDGSGDYGQNTLAERVIQLATPVTARGIVQTPDGKPLAGVGVSVWRFLAPDGRGYPLTKIIQAMSDEQGRFELAGLPAGYFQLNTSTVLSLHQLERDRLYGKPYDKIVVLVGPYDDAKK